MTTFCNEMIIRARIGRWTGPRHFAPLAGTSSVVLPGMSLTGRPPYRHPDYLSPGDILVVWKLDRLGRSVREVLTTADDLHAAASA